MSEVDTSFADAFDVLALLGETVTVTFGSATATGVLTVAENGSEDFRVRKSGGKQLKLSMLSTAFSPMPKENNVIKIGNISHRVTQAPFTPDPIVTYEISDGYTAT